MHFSVLKTDFRVRIDSVLDIASLGTPVSPFNFSLENLLSSDHYPKPTPK